MRTIEILTNTECKRGCPQCNQIAWRLVENGYKYTPENAENLVTVLKKYNKKYDVVMSGGEPTLNKDLPQICKILKNSGVIQTISITSSSLSPMFKKLWAYIDNLYFSWRNDRNPDDCLPYTFREHRDKIHFWNSKYHVLFPKEPYTGSGYCCCTHVGVFCAIRGDEVFPCTLALNHSYTLAWTGLEPYTLEEYFSGIKKYPPIGTYDACKWCVNNQGYRDWAMKNGEYTSTTKSIQQYIINEDDE